VHLNASKAPESQVPVKLANVCSSASATLTVIMSLPAFREYQVEPALLAPPERVTVPVAALAGKMATTDSNNATTAKRPMNLNLLLTTFLLQTVLFLGLERDYKQMIRT
jgi:hypothetical protein